MAWGSPPWHIGARDRFIGWSKEERETNLHLIADNLRFLIPPWIEVPCLASYLPALNRRRLSEDWQRLYHHPIHLVETFVDAERYRGACYKADNWICVGQPGHDRNVRAPFAEDEIDFFHPCIPTGCPVCDGRVDLLDMPPKIIRQI